MKELLGFEMIGEGAEVDDPFLFGHDIEVLHAFGGDVGVLRHPLDRDTAARKLIAEHSIGFIIGGANVGDGHD